MQSKTLVFFLLAYFTMLNWAAAESIPSIRATLDTDMFPQNWTDERADALQDADSIQEAKALVQTELEKYPEDLIKKTLTRVYVVDTLYKGRIKQGGTNSSHNVYIEAKNLSSLNCAVRANFHAEYSSVLLRKYASQFSWDEWTSNNPVDFSYNGSSGNQAIASGVASSRDYSLDEIKQNGGAFLSQYAKADQEDDFNSVAKRIFMGNRTLWAAYDKKDLKIKAKVDLFIKFYNSLDESFNYEFFRNISSCR